MITFKQNIFMMAALLFMIIVPPKGHAITLSPQAQITMLTASPGDELYSVFGHSALRVTDQHNNIDLVFNYGTFDFDTPNFYLQFTRGKLLYKLSVVPMQYFLLEYQYEGRAIFEQVLNLTPTEKQNVFDFLLINQLPENAYYHYDFFYDNCATRIRDLADDILNPIWEEEINQESLRYIQSLLNYEFEYEPDLNGPRTFRDLLQPFLVNMPWSAFGIDLALGLPADKVATAWDYMYLPDEMLMAFALAVHPDGRPLVSEHRTILTKTLELSPAGTVSPQMVFWFVFVLGIFSLYAPKYSKAFDKAFFSVLGLTGFVVVFLWFFTDHITTKANLNILWALPTHIYFIWVANYGNNRSIVKWYFKLVTILSLLLVLLWPLLPQAYHPAFFPIILTALIKSAIYGFGFKVLPAGLKKIMGTNSK